MTEAAILRVLASLVLIVLLILALAWMARRRGWLQGRAQTPVRVLGSTRVGVRAHILIVEMEGQRLVLGVTPAQINHLATLSAPPRAAATDHSAAPQPDPPTDFRSALRRHLCWLPGALALGLLLALPETGWAQATLPALSASAPGPDGSQTWSLSVQTLTLLTALSFLPAMVLTMTGFTRIIIVLGLLRNAMGTGASPPNSILIGLALFLTWFAMSPVFDQVYDLAWKPLSDGSIGWQDAVQLGLGPMREFMLQQTRETDLSLFTHLAGLSEFETPQDVPLHILLPSFVTSELKTAFQIGFTIFIPFLIIDLVVASILMSLGMMMVPPVTISLPFKLMLFVLADGWHLLLGALARSFSP